MALADRLSKLESAARQDCCSFGKFLTELPNDTKDVMLRVLATKISNAELRLELAAEGHRFSRDTIGNHRTGKCICTVKQVTR